MNERRKFVLTATGITMGAALAKTGLSNLLINDAAAAENTDHSTDSGRYSDLVKSASDCIRAGELCQAHCQDQLGKGNTSFSSCNKKVHEMLSLTRAMLTLAAMDSALTPKLAAVCADACKACSDACAEHKEHFAHGMHMACKNCMEACNTCEKACRKVAA